MRFSARLEAALWGWPKHPGPGSDAFSWARYAHAVNDIAKANKCRPSKDRYRFVLEPAIEFFDICWPVSIWVVPLLSIGCNGQIVSRAYYDDQSTVEGSEGHYHAMFVADTVDSEHASSLAWHELCHAAQHERLHARGIPFKRQRMLGSAAFPIGRQTWRRYASSRYEREAYEAMNYHYSVSKLTVDL